MNSSDLLRRAAAAMCGPGAYSAKSDALAYLAVMQPYNASTALERANCKLKSGAVFCSRGDPRVLDEAKARVCRVVGYPHLDLWEWHARPSWQDVRQAYLEAA